MTTGDSDPFEFFNQRLPPREQWPTFLYDLPHLQLPDQLNTGSWFLDPNIHAGRGRATALVGTHESWTYDDLYHRVGVVAGALAEVGAGPGDRVLLLGRNTPELVAAWYAVLRLGAVAAFLAPASSTRDVSQAVHRILPKVILCDETTEGLALDAASGGALAIRIDGPSASGRVMDVESTGADTTAPPAATEADAPCLIAFTSGSTGEPKAVVHSHRELGAMCRSFTHGALGATSQDVFVGSSPLAFTFGLISQACYPIALGGTSVLLPRPSPEALLDAVHAHRATFCFSVPTAYRRWLRADESRLRGAVASVRVAVASGEPLSASLWSDFKAATGIGLTNVLGSTEMLHAFMSTGPYDAPPGSVGGPVAGFHVRILDSLRREIRGPGVGLLAVQGPTGCRYLDDPRQAEQVVDGWNLTGDLVRRDESGHYWVEGRMDSVIVSSGYKIPAVEVEQCLLEHPDVSEAVVLALPDTERGNMVLALVVLRQGAVGGEEQARRLAGHVAGRLAKYKAPRVFRFVPELPRTATGKVSRVRPHVLGASGETIRVV